MKKLLNYLGCRSKQDLIYQFKNSDSEEIAELRMAFELIAEDRVMDDEIRLKDKKSLLDFLKFKVGFKEREEFVVIFLNNYNVMTGYEVLFTGTIDKSAVYPREIAERVFKYKAKGVIFAHNHPSGNLRPSKQDIQITEHMQEFLEMIDVKLLEHIIITKDGHFSFLQEGII
jgi:DNA repair protein RadC